MSATRAKASKSTRAKRRSDCDAASKWSMVAMRAMGWSLSTDQIALRIAGTNVRASPRVRTTTDMTESAQYHWEFGIYTASLFVSSNESWRTSATTPTIVDQGWLGPGSQRMQIRRPMGSWLENLRLARASLINATFGEVAVSRSVKKRPERRGMRMVSR